MTNKLNDDTSAQQDNFVADFLNIKETESELPSSASVGKGASITDMVLEQQIVDALRGVYDPEIPINIYDLGLIYGIDIDENKVVKIEMTLTTPGCPVAQTFPGTVECAVKCVDSVEDVHVELVWDPPWTKDRMTEDALLSLGLL